MPLVPLFGHVQVRQHLLGAVARGALPASLLLHGPRGVGKQRLALWLGQALLCERAAAGEPACDACRHCRLASQFAHPDLAWYFPRVRPKEADPDAEEVRADYAELRAERAAAHGLYAPSPGNEGLQVATTRALVQQASRSPALARRKVFVVGDADRMVAQEGAEQAANAFLKLLEEPPADTTLVLTSSEAGALLPTIRSRVVSVRVPPLARADVRAFLADARVGSAIGATGPAGGGDEAMVDAAGGAPGVLLAATEQGAAVEGAERLLRAALEGDRGDHARASLAQGAAGARGAFADVLEALTVRLHGLARGALVDGGAGDEAGRARALGAARAVDAVERAKLLAAGNVSPQLVAAALVRQMGAALR